MTRKRAEDEATVKEHQRTGQNNCMKNKRVTDNNKIKEGQVKKSRLCRTKKKLDDPEKAKIEQKEQQQRHREVNNRSGRLREFRETDEMIKEEGLKLSEIEDALIAKSIIFQKIYQLPKSKGQIDKHSNK